MKEIQPHLFEYVLRETAVALVNDLLARGWQICAIEYEGETTLYGEVLHRTAHFVLGHADLQAALATVEARESDLLSRL